MGFFFGEAMKFQKNEIQPKPTFASIVENEIPVLYRVARSLSRNDSDVEDLVGQTLLLAARAWDRFDEEFPRSWMIRILRNEFFGLARKKGSQPVVSIEHVSEPGNENYWDEIDGEISVQDILVEVRKLSSDFRDVLTLCDVEEMSYEEAAVALDIPIGTVRSRLHRGRNVLRSRLVKLYKAEPGVIQ